MTDSKLKLKPHGDYDFNVADTNISYYQRVDTQQDVDYIKCKEVAKKIAHCVNGHQSLIDALEATLEDLRMRAETDDDGIKVLGIGCGVLAQIEAALLAARG